jgi:hypothetical protein
MNHPVMSNSCPKPDSCRFTGCQGECAQSLPAAACVDAGNSSPLFARDVAWHRSSASPFKVRDPLAQRRLLVAS